MTATAALELVQLTKMFGSVTAVVLARKGKRQAGAGGASAAPSPARTVSVVCKSPSLGGTMPTLVYLPAGYSASSPRRYPAVYFLTVRHADMARN